MKPIVILDIETTGLDPETCQILEIFAIVDNLAVQEHIDYLPRFHCYVQHPEYRGEPYALWLNARILKILAAGYDENYPKEKQVRIVKAENVAKEMVYWLNRVFGFNPDGMQVKWQAGGKNIGPFDYQFLKRLSNWDKYHRVNHRFYDPAMLYYNPKIDEKLPDLSTCWERQFPGQSLGKLHTAEDDALAVLRLLRAKYEPQRMGEVPDKQTTPDSNRG